MGFYKDKVCQSCGTGYMGTASSKYCIECKVDIMDQRNREANIKYKEKKRHEGI